MPYQGPFSNRLKANLVQIIETDISAGGDTDSGGVDTSPIILDATVDYSKDFSASLTNNPVSDRRTVSDHYDVHPFEIHVSGVMSNDSLSIIDWAKSFGSESRTQQYVERMESIFNDKKVINLVMPDGLTTPDCMLTSLSISRDASWSNGFRVSFTAQQITFVDIGVIKVKPAEKQANSVANEKKEGNKTTVSGEATKGGAGDGDIIIRQGDKQVYTPEDTST